MSHIIKAVTKPITHLVDAIPGGNILAPIVLTALGQPELAAAYAGANTLNHGGSLGQSLLSAGLSYGGSALGGNDTIFGDTLSGPINGAINNLGSNVSGALGDLGKSTGLSSLYNDASGALGSAKNSISDSLSSAYNGSGLQSAFNSGSDALKSIGIGSGATTTSAPVGGGSSSYGDIGNAGGFLKDTANNSSSALNSGISNAIPQPSLSSAYSPVSTALNNSTTTGGNVASSSFSNYLAPLASAGIGTLANNSAQQALLKQAGANKALLAPYANGFKFTPGDLTQDPGYQFNLAQGNQALSRRQNAGGDYFSGAALKEAQDYGQGLADNTYNAAYNRGLQGFNTGLTGAAATAGVNDSIGNINATNAVNQGNLYSGALGNILGGNSFTNSGALQGGNDMQSILRRIFGGK